MHSRFPVRLCELLLLLLLAAMIFGCSAPTYRRSAAACPPPPPPPECRPASFTALVYDTTTNAAPGASWWTIDAVQGASTDAAEFGLIVPASDRAVVVGGRDASDARYREVVLERVNVVRTPTTNDPTGRPPLSFRATDIRPGAIIGDASVADITLLADGTLSATSLDAPVNIPVAWDGHPTTSPTDRRIMVFASDRVGSIGGTDLWMSVNGGAPRPLPGMANTACDELFPSFTPDGSALLFSSAGHATVGGYDLFRATLRYAGDSIVATSVENIERPVNTPADEIHPVQVGATTLYYGSNQRSTFDVFVLHRRTNPTKAGSPPPVVPPTPEPTTIVERATITGVVINEQTQQPVPDAEVTAREPNTREVISSTRTDSSGRYALDVPVDTPLDVQAQTADLFHGGFRAEVPKERARDTIVRERPIALPLTFVLRVNFPTSVFDAPYEFTLDSNGVETAQTWASALDELATNVKAGIGKLKRLVLIGHTDDVDSDASNQRLGQRRVDFIMSELEQRGVPRSLMEGRSAGERLTPQRRSNESVDTWRKRCRRVELVKVMS